MRYLRTLASASALALTVACTEKTTRDLTAPDTNTPVRVQPTDAVSSPYCDAKTDVEIIAAIEELYFKNQWPDPNSATGKFGQVTSALDAGNVQGAILATRNLVDFITNKYNHLSSPTGEQTTAFETLIADLWCFVGISGQVFDLNPGDPAKVFTIPGIGGVWFPANVVPVGTMVVLTNISDQVAPLSTLLDQFSSFIDIQLIPAYTFTPPNLPIVVVCPEAGPTGLLLGHNGPDGFEVLAPVDFSGITELATLCGPASVRNNASQGWLAHWATRAASLLLPRTLQASMLIGGIGGSPLGFSPFGAVSTTLVGTDGLGGSTTQFAPRPQTSAGPAGSAPLPSNYLDGTVGTDGSTADPDWPVVTIKTLGGDADGQNPIPGVTVTFTIGATNDYEPDSQAAVCDAQGTVQASVQVVTDANGVAVLPCLKFGTVAGFANLQASFDASTVGFPGDELLQVNSNVGGVTSNTLNWLVQSNAGPAASILTSMPPAAPAASFTYPGLQTSGTPVSTDPRVLVRDQYGNPVSTTVTWTAVNSTVDATGGSPSDADGLAQVTSWTPGVGESTLLASVDGVLNPATFSASTPLGASVFMCELGEADGNFMSVGNSRNKTDLAPIRVADPKTNIVDLFFYMSVTGQSSSFATYDVDLKVYRTAANATAPSGSVVGSTTGTVGLPGNNGQPQLQHLRLTSPVLAATGNNALWFVVTTVGAPENRTFQVWYSTLATNKLSTPCKNSFVKTGSTLRVGAAVLLQN